MRGGIADKLNKGMRVASAPARVLPDFLILGAQKAGTTSMFGYLTQFPDIRRGTRKEVHFFDNRYGRGERWYRSHFPAALPGRTWVTGEATPYYLFHPAVPGRVARTLPEGRFIALLRHPVARAYSHFQHSRALGKEPVTDFEEAVLLEPERTDRAWRQLERDGAADEAVKLYSYVRRGQYAPQLKRWLNAVPGDSLLILIAEELFEDPRGVVERARKHLGMRPTTYPVDLTPRNWRSYEALPERTRQRLGEAFADDVAEVERLLGRRTGWQL